jgi:DNA end-binding protein Ku
MGFVHAPDRPETRGKNAYREPECRNPCNAAGVSNASKHEGICTMAPRPSWKGYLKLSLVTCAVELTNATTETEKVSFHVLNRKTGNRVRRIYVDAETGKPVEDDEQVKGYETSKGNYLLIEEDEIEEVQIESNHTMTLDSFVKREEIEQVYLDTPYYLAPADKVSEEAFAAIRDALAKSKMGGLARVVLYRRERPVLIEALGKGMLVTTLRYDKTVRKADEVLDEIRNVKIDPEIVDLAEHIIAKKKAKFDPSKFEDRYEDALLDLIKAKKAGKKPPVVKAEPPSNVINLFDALKKSLKQEGIGAKSKPAARSKASGRRAAGARSRSKTAHASRRKSA